VTSLAINAVAGVLLYVVGGAGVLWISLREDDARRTLSAIGCFGLLLLGYILAFHTSWQFAGAVAFFLCGLILERAKGPIAGERRLAYALGFARARSLTESGLDAATLDRMTGRAALTASRHAPFVAEAIDITVEICAARVPHYWAFDVVEKYTYQATGRTPVPLKLQVRPIFLDSDDGARPTPSSPSRPPYRSDRAASKWTISYWPTVVNQADWDLFSPYISAWAAQLKSRNPKEHRQLPLQTINTVATPETAPIVEYAADIEFDDNWDTLVIGYKGLPHSHHVRSFYLYAWDICVGTWSIECRTRGPENAPVINRVTPITTYDLVVETTTRPHFGRAVFKAGDLAVMPEDAVLMGFDE
jgi:hypothetical protein